MCKMVDITREVVTKMLKRNIGGTRTGKRGSERCGVCSGRGQTETEIKYALWNKGEV